MRGAITYLLSSIGTFILTVACSTEPANIDVDSVRYAPVVTLLGTHSAEGLTNLYPEDTPFIVWVGALDQNQSWASDAENSTCFIDSEQVIWNGKEWNTSINHQWPIDKSLSLMAYSPADITATFSVQYGIQFNNIDVLNQGRDMLMFANPVSNQFYNFNQGVIPIPFIHAFAQVSFSVIPHVPSDVEVVVKEISLSNIQHSGSFCSLPEASWKPTGETCKMIFFDGEERIESSNYKLIGTTEWVLPQSVIARVKVVCDFHAHGTVIPDQVFEVDENMLWEVGKSYAYTIKINMDGISFLHDVIADEF